MLLHVKKVFARRVVILTSFVNKYHVRQINSLLLEFMLSQTLVTLIFTFLVSFVMLTAWSMSYMRACPIASLFYSLSSDLGNFGQKIISNRIPIISLNRSGSHLRIYRTSLLGSEFLFPIVVNSLSWAHGENFLWYSLCTQSVHERFVCIGYVSSYLVL